MESVKKVTDIVAEIAAASEEQSAGIEQVNNAVTQMDNVTQQNAAVVEQASAASKAMEQQSSTLVSQIGYFRIGKGSAAHEIRQGDTAAMQARGRHSRIIGPLTRSPAPRTLCDHAQGAGDRSRRRRRQPVPAAAEDVRARAAMKRRGTTSRSRDTGDHSDTGDTGQRPGIEPGADVHAR